MQYVVRNDQRYLNVDHGPQYVPLQFATVLRSRERAYTLAKKHNGTVELFTGREIPMGTKSTVAPKQSPINRRSPYRTV